MSGSAVAMLVIGLTLVWGGLATSIAWAVHVQRRSREPGTGGRRS